VTPDLACVIRTQAVPPGAPEIRRAAEARVPVAARGEVLPLLLRGRPAIAVAGTHGKTTTSSFAAQVLRLGGRSPTWCVGGTTDALGGVAGGDGAADAPMVAEADESDGTLALYAPDIAVITNIERDHMEHFGSEDALRGCFRAFARNARRAVVFCADDPGASAVCAGMPGAVSFGFSAAASVRGEIIEETATGTRFRAVIRGGESATVGLPVPGRHNVLNALAVMAALCEAGMRPDAIAAGLGGVGLPRRRFERVWCGGGIEVISDYAHHPSEIAALVRTAARQGGRRILAVFQPHRYTRTLALGAEFPGAFEGVGTVILAPVYAASEAPLPGGTTWDLYARFRAASPWAVGPGGRQPGSGAPAVVLASDSLAEAWEYVRRELREGDALLVVGAGDVETVALRAAEHLGAGPAEPARVPAGLVSPATRVRCNEPLAPRTTLGVGGTADVWAEVGNREDLRALLLWARERGMPFRVLGGGSNVLVSDLGARGVTARLAGPQFGAIAARGGLVVAGAGAPLRRLLDWMEERGLGGLEFLEGIPGTVGGAVRMNAGAAGGQIGDRIEWIRGLNADGSECTLAAGDLGLGYRRCEALRGRIVVEAALRPEPVSPEEIRRRRAGLALKREWFRGLRCAGSVFRNPEGDFAGRLIEAAGLKGASVGGARVCAEHANVIAAGAGARASDVRALMELARASVEARFGVRLDSEIVLPGGGEGG
jgi:UDP-N-acetylenolpyruvoylglucosamine reductase